MAADTPDKPLAKLSQTEAEINAPAPTDARDDTPGAAPVAYEQGAKPQGDLHPESHSQSVKTVGETSASERLRAFEDEELPKTGVEIVRINGQVERGSGSAYDRMPASKKRKYVALTRLVEAEIKVDQARAMVSVAESEAAAISEEVDREDDAIAAEENHESAR